MTAPALGDKLHYRLKTQFEDWAPLLVTSVHDEGRLVNGQVLLDGVNHASLGGGDHGGTLMVYSAPEGTGPGCWRWPTDSSGRAGL